MPADTSAKRGSRAAAKAAAGDAVALMEEISAGLRGCAILDQEGRVLAASGDARAWGGAGNELLAAADAADPARSAEQAHVGTEDGEAFALRFGELAMVAVSDRFALSSLVFSDMRTLLRDIAAGGARDRRAPGRGVAAEQVEADAATPPAG